MVNKAPVDTLSLDHLLPHVQKLATLPANERIQRIRSERWIGYSKAQEAIAKLTALINHPQKDRMPNLLLIGPTNNGKTMIIEKFKKMRQKELATLSGSHEHMPVVSLQMPSDPTIARFYAMLLYRMGAPFKSKAKVSELEFVSIEILTRVKAKMLIIDELHNILAGRMNVQREFLNLIRFLGNELKIPIVCVGTREAYLALRSDDQLENRFEPHILPKWIDDVEFGSLLASYATALPLKKQSNLLEPEVRSFIFRNSEGTIGEINQIITRAAVFAIETGDECITHKSLTAIDYNPPTERRRMFERELQS